VGRDSPSTIQHGAAKYLSDSYNACLIFSHRQSKLSCLSRCDKENAFFLQAAIIILVAASITNSFVSAQTPITLLVYGVPVPSIDVTDFVFTDWIGSVFVVIAHVILLYTLRRPQTEEKNSTKVDRIDVSRSVSDIEIRGERSPTTTTSKTAPAPAPATA